MTSSQGSSGHPLRHASFRLFWLGQTVSVLGDRVYAVALPFLVFELGGGAEQLGRLAAAYTVPQLLFLLLGGVLVDRLPRRGTLVASDLFHVAVLAGVLFLLVTEWLELSHLYALAALFGLASAFFMPASLSIVPSLVPAESLTSANALRSFSTHLTGVLGPSLWGILIAFGGHAFALAFDTATFIIGALCLSAMRLPNAAAMSGTRSSYGKDLREGFRYVLASSWLWVTILVFALVNIFVSGSVVVVLPVLAEERFGGAGALGWLLSSLAGGALLSSLLLGGLGRMRRRGLLAYGGVALTGVALVGLALSPSLYSALAASALLGSSLTVFGVIWESTLQEFVPGEVLGRVASVDMLGSFALLPLGFLLLGMWLERADTGSVLIICGGGTTLLALLVLALPAVRTLD